MATDRAVPTVADAVQHANLPTLVAVAYQLTGDLHWLDDRFQATRPPGMSPHNGGGYSSAIADAIRRGSYEALNGWLHSGQVAIPLPTLAEMHVLMQRVVGEPVPDEYALMASEEMGFKARSAPTETLATSGHDRRILIIGAGISGLTIAWQLDRAGLNYEIVDKNHAAGGTWLENQYPGCGVDTPSHLYSWSFAPGDWSSHFAKRDEVLAYVQSLVGQLEQPVTYRTEVISAAYDERASRWNVTFQAPDDSKFQSEYDFVITAVGQLNQPKMPQVPGLTKFRGHMFHSARYPAGLDMVGKKVAVVGTGASAMQIVPKLAPIVQSLTVFQRSPQWIAPNDEYFDNLSAGERWLLRQVPLYREWYRVRLAWIHNDRIHPSLVKDATWPHPERSVNATNESHRQYFLKYLTDQLAGRDDLIRKCSPNYPPFGKRILIDNGWYDALKKPNVEIISEAVTAFGEHTVISKLGRQIAADVVVLATGFNTTQILAPIQITGRRGLLLRDAWNEDDPSAYLGIAFPDFPNLLFMYGPNTSLGHGGSLIFVAEAQARYIADLIVQAANRGLTEIEVRRDVYEKYRARVDAAHAQMLWTHPGMDTWYRNRHGRVVANMPWRVVDYWHMTQHSDLEDYDVRRARSVPPEAAIPKPVLNKANNASGAGTR